MTTIFRPLDRHRPPRSDYLATLTCTPFGSRVRPHVLWFDELNDEAHYGARNAEPAVVSTSAESRPHRVGWLPLSEPEPVRLTTALVIAGTMGGSSNNPLLVGPPQGRLGRRGWLVVSSGRRSPLVRSTRNWRVGAVSQAPALMPRTMISVEATLSQAFAGVFGDELGVLAQHEPDHKLPELGARAWIDQQPGQRSWVLAV